MAHPPWVTDSAGLVGGVEPQLVSSLARELGARVEWVRQPESVLMLALRARQVDLVIGGLTADLPWKSEVAFTRRCYTDTVVVATPPGTSLRHVHGQVVSVEPGDALTAELRKRGARPAVVAELSRAPGPILAPSWRPGRLQRRSTGLVVAESKQVMAVPTGENAWLVRLERKLRESEGEVPGMLRGAP